MSKITPLNATQFAEQIEQSEHLTLVDFHAHWCGPCKMIEPSLESLAEEYDGRVRFAKVDADQHPEVLVKYGVRGLPTLLMFERGHPVGTLVGANPTSALRDFIETHVA
jgi:thioredoxin 1